MKGSNSKRIISNKEYHEHAAIGSSFCKKAAQKTLHHAIEEEYKDSRDKLIGSVLHGLLLEPEEFNKEFALELNRNDFDGALETVQEIKDKIQDLKKKDVDKFNADLEKIKKEFKAFDAKFKHAKLKLESELTKRIDNVDKSSFKKVADYNKKISEIKKESKADLKSLKDNHEAKKESLKDEEKKINQILKDIKSLSTGTKDELITNLRAIDPSVIIWSEIVERHKLDAEDKTLVPNDVYEIALEMKKAVLAHPVAKGMLNNSITEYSYFTYDEDTQLEIKCRPDIESMGELIDLKTTQDASDKGFMYECLKWGYHIQAAYYLDIYNKVNGTDIEQFYFIAVEKKPPFAVNVHVIEGPEIQIGRMEYKKVLKEYAHYLKNQDTKPLSEYGYGNKINKIMFSDYKLNELESKFLTSESEVANG